MLTVDAGNLLFPANSGSGKRSETLFTAAHGILSAYKLMGYDAVGVSGNDVTAGYSFFTSAHLLDFPFVSANIYDDAGKHVFKPYIIKTFNSRQVAIIGLTGRAHMDHANLNIRDWKQSLEDTITTLPQCDIVLVLSSLSESENFSLLEHYPKIDITLTSTPNSANLPVKIVGQTLVAQGGSQGKYLGKLDIDWYGHSRWGKQEPNKLELLQNKLKTIKWYIEELSSQQQSERRSKLEASKKALEKQIAELSSSSKSIDKQTRNNYHSTVLPVIPNDTPVKVQKIIDQITDSISNLQ